MINWSDPVGNEELQEIRSRFSQDCFIREIAMPHPQIISYPLPRLLHIARNYSAASVCQPKDELCRRLIGRTASDIWSWRGLYHPDKGVSKYLLNELGITLSIPSMYAPDTKIGGIFAPETGIPDGTPLYVGMNDFYCSLLGMGIKKGDIFDITGTSEHIGYIGDCLTEDFRCISGPYLEGYVSYAVTASSGVSLRFGMDNFNTENIDIERSLDRRSPVFLPYLNGERAPIFDSCAKGSFFGISADTDNIDLAYSVFEGNVFSIYSIYKALGMPSLNRLIVSGGASKNKVLNRLKAEMFDCPVYSLSESETSAVGAAILAGAKIENFMRLEAEPSGLKQRLLKRFDIYEELYPALKDKFKKWKEI